jgi:DNA-binding PucR family transcriptional regulator
MTALSSPPERRNGDHQRVVPPRDDRVAALEALIEVSTQIHAEEFQAESVLTLIVERARTLIGADVAWMGLADEERHRSTAAVADGAETTALLSVEVELGTGLSGLAASAGRTIILSGDELYASVPKSAAVALRTERLQTVMCAPMRHEREVGALLVGSRHEADFDEAAAALLQAFASQAAVTIANSRLYKALADQNRTLERTLSLHRALGDTALTGDGLDAIVERLARLIDRDIALVAPGELGPAWRYSGSDQAERQALSEPDVAKLVGRQGVEIVVAGELLGTLHALGTHQISELQHNAMLHGATIVALEMTKERAAHEVEWRLRGELLEEILQAGESSTHGLRTRCERLGVDLAAERCLAVFEPIDEATTAALAAVIRSAAGRLVEGRTTLISRRGDSVIVALETTAPNAKRAVEDVLTRAKRAGAATRAGLSGARHQADVALREAQAALRLARTAEKPEALVSYEELGRLRFMLAAPDTTEMTSMVSELLGPLADYDRSKNSSLMETLRAYLDAGGHQPTTAQQCHIHLSTLKYRLGRISELLGCSLTSPSARFELALAFSVRDLLSTLGINAP